MLELFTDIHTAPLFSTRSRLWGFVGGKAGFFLFGLKLQQYEGTILFCPEPGKRFEFKLLTQRKAVNVSPSIKHEKTSSKSLCLSSAYIQEIQQNAKHMWMGPVFRLKWSNTIQQHLS